MEKKIATALNVRVNVGNYQHIELTKYAEQSISYESEEEMIAKEDALTESLIDETIRSMKKIPDRLGKKTTAVENLEESIKKEIPRWLEEGAEPNLAASKANLAKKKHTDKVSEVKDKEDQEKNGASTDIEEFLSEDEENNKTEENETADIFEEDDGELF